jgi:hypothetical protein
MASASLGGYGQSQAQSSLYRHSQQPTITSTLTAMTYIPGKDKQLTFASEWVFKPEGIKAVKIRFEEMMKKNDLVGLR